MEDDGTITERGPLGRGSVNKLTGLKYLRSTILETHVIVQIQFFEDTYLFSRTSKNLRNFCPPKIYSYMVCSYCNLKLLIMS